MLHASIVITDGMFQRLFMISYLDEEILVCLSHTYSNQQNHTTCALYTDDIASVLKYSSPP
jgi:hypothetical protein